MHAPLLMIRGDASAVGLDRRLQLRKECCIEKDVVLSGNLKSHTTCHAVLKEEASAPREGLTPGRENKRVKP